MTTGDIILQIFYLVDDAMPSIAQHPQSKLYTSELVTIGILLSLKSGYFRAFFRWLKRDYGDWFGKCELPECTRLQRLLKTHPGLCYYAILKFQRNFHLQTILLYNLT